MTYISTLADRVTSRTSPKDFGPLSSIDVDQEVRGLSLPLCARGCFRDLLVRLLTVVGVSEGVRGFLCALTRRKGFKAHSEPAPRVCGMGRGEGYMYSVRRAIKYHQKYLLPRTRALRCVNDVFFEGRCDSFCMRVGIKLSFSRKNTTNGNLPGQLPFIVYCIF